MQKRKTKMALKTMITLSLFVAISIVCGKFLAIPVGEILRFSFENLPIIMAGMLFGPVGGVVVGVMADLIGCVLKGYTIVPLVTVGAGVVGLVSGLTWKPIQKTKIPYVFRIILTVFVSHFWGSVIVKTFGLADFYSLEYNMSVEILMLWRFLNYVIVGGIEGVLLFFLMKNKMITSQFHRGDNA